MTNHEAIQFLNNMIDEEHGRSIGKEGFYRELCAYHVDALKTAIKALSQQPEDAISRQAVLDAIEDDNRNGHYSCFASNNDAQCFKGFIGELPSVNPQEPFMNKPCVAHQVCHEDKIKVLNKIRAEIAEYGSIWVVYKITGIKDKDIERLVNDVLKQAKEQVLDVIDKYIAESEGEHG